MSIPSFVSPQTILSACLAALKLVPLCMQVTFYVQRHKYTYISNTATCLPNRMLMQISLMDMI